METPRARCRRCLPPRATRRPPGAPAGARGATGGGQCVCVGGGGGVAWGGSGKSKHRRWQAWRQLQPRLAGVACVGACCEGSLRATPSRHKKLRGLMGLTVAASASPVSAGASQCRGLHGLDVRAAPGYNPRHPASLLCLPLKAAACFVWCLSGDPGPLGLRAASGRGVGRGPASRLGAGVVRPAEARLPAPQFPAISTAPTH